VIITEARVIRIVNTVVAQIPETMMSVVTVKEQGSDLPQLFVLPLKLE
jgi:hypothetical protein